jgi:hypothetical protein
MSNKEHIDNFIRNVFFSRARFIKCKVEAMVSQSHRLFEQAENHKEKQDDGLFVWKMNHQMIEAFKDDAKAILKWCEDIEKSAARTEEEVYKKD